MVEEGYPGVSDPSGPVSPEEEEAILAKPTYGVSRGSSGEGEKKEAVVVPPKRTVRSPSSRQRRRGEKGNGLKRKKKK